MTIEELNQLAYLEKAIALETDRLESLRESIDVKSPALTAMPKAPGAHDKLGETVPKIVDQEQELEEKIQKLNEMKERLTQYIEKTGNVRMHMILTLRFIQQRPWQEIAEYLGGKETEYSVKQACYRYVEGRDTGPISGQISMFDDKCAPQNVQI